MTRLAVAALFAWLAMIAAPEAARKAAHDGGYIPRRSGGPRDL